MSYPSKYAMVELFHERIDTNKFSIRQQFLATQVLYRTAKIELYESDDKIVVKNFRDDLTPLPGCDIIFTWSGSEFIGTNSSKECLVYRNNKPTFFTTQCTLSNGFYHVLDRGFDLETNKQIWGSEYGPFKFIKMPL